MRDIVATFVPPIRPCYSAGWATYFSAPPARCRKLHGERIPRQKRPRKRRRPPTATTRYVADIQQAGRKREWDRILSLLGLAKGDASLRLAVHYVEAAKAFALGGRWRDADDILRDVVSADWASERDAAWVCNSAMGAANKARAPEQALEWFNAYFDIEAGILRGAADAFSYGCGMSAALKLGRNVQVLQLLRTMQVLGMSPDLHCYSFSITASARLGRWQDSISLLGEMKCAGLQPNVFTYGSAIDAVSQGGGEVEAVRCLLSDMKADGVTPNAILYSSAIKACARQANAAEALSLLDDMLSQGVSADLHVFNVALQAVAAAASASRPSSSSLGDAAETVLQKLRDLGLTPDSYSICFALRAGTPTQAAASLRSLHEKRLPLSARAIASALEPCMRDAAWEEALQLIEWASDAGITLDVVSYTCAITTCARAKRPQEVLHLLEHVEELERQSKGEVRLDEVPYAASMPAGDLAFVLHVLERMRLQGIARTPGAARSAMAALSLLLKDGDCTDERGLNVLLDIFEHFPGGKQDRAAHNIAITACGRSGQWQRALSIFENMLRLNVNPDAITYTAAIDACARGGRWVESRDLLSDMASSGLEVTEIAHTSVFDACASSPDSEVQAATSCALDIISRLGNPTNAHLMTVVGLCGRSGAWEPALSLWRRGGGGGGDLHAAAIGVCGVAGAVDAALEVLREVPPEMRTGDAYTRAAQACARKGDQEKALQLLEEAKSLGVTRGHEMYHAVVRAFITAAS
jgi:pentatricopeptide repeat domain-containing protein 1